MRQIACAIALLVLLPTAALPPQPAQTLDELKGQAEKSYSEKSFGRAHELYEKVSRLQLPQAEKRWVELRLADTAWRTDAANPVADSTARDAASEELQRLIREARDDHDRVWAEANESLGDYWWTHPKLRNLQAAQMFYVAALEWWAGSSDIAVARRRYLDIVFRMALPTQWEPGENGRMVPREVLVNAISIAESREDRVHAQYLLATQLMSDFTPATVERTLELLEAVIRDGKGMPWYDDAIYAAASRYVQPGAVTINDDGATVFKPDFEKALALYRRIVTEFAESETRYYGEAKRALDEIIAPSVGVAASSTFLPKSEQQVILMWRNVKQVELTLTPVDLVDDVHLSYSNFGNWADAMAAGGRAPLRRWTYTTNDTGDHAPKSEPIRITPKLDTGAYLITASAGGKTARQVLLVTDVTIVTHTAGPRTDYFVCDAVTGQPVSGARVRIWQQKDQNNVPTLSATTNASGYATTSFKEASYGTIFIAASAPEHRQAWLNTWNYGNYRENHAQWRIYAFTDRPAYRPDETVQWKFVARVRNDNEWITPARETIDYEIRSPRGEQVAAGKATLNEFGTFWSDLPVTPAMALGPYTITFTKLNAKNQTEAIGNAVLFRLEEYKLPEFRVEVKTPEENGKRKQYRLGDTVEAAIEANYYFGGPVANATVQVVVRSAPFYQYWYPWREYGWYYDSRQPRYDRGQEIRNETVKTDAQGRAVVRVDTSPDAQNTELTIEARVTDASRREVVGQGFVKVMRQRYSVVAQPAHYVHRPSEKVSVTFKAMDANEQPVQATGKVKVFRRAWEEVTKPRFIGYREEEILTTTATTDSTGEATISFNANGVGYYTVRWASEDRDPKSRVRARDIVNAETSVWVTNTATTDIGYHTSGGVEIIVDKETFRSGQNAAVLIATPASGRWVMLTTSANGILDTQIVRLDGNVKLVQLPITDRNVPVFYITASSVSDRMLATVAQRVVVPPVEHFIDVEVKPDRDQYEPREEGSFVITTRTVDGKPIAAEVAVGVSDESVTAIQSEIAGDPRQFFFGADNAYPVQAAASVQMQQYV
ncbi:MAG: MG2 domain-containing protein, partial [Thermoanaerobaculia bacterium]